MWMNQVTQDQLDFWHVVGWLLPDVTIGQGAPFLIRSPAEGERNPELAAWHRLALQLHADLGVEGGSAALLLQAPD